MPSIDARICLSVCVQSGCWRRLSRSVPVVYRFITTATAIYSPGHGLHTLAYVDSAFDPPWDGKLSQVK